MSEEYVAPAVANTETPAPTEIVINPEVGNTPNEPTPPTEPRVFSQEDVDKIVAKRLGKAERNWERRNREVLETALNRVAQPQQQAPAPQQGSGEPDPAKYESYTEYLRDLTRYEANQAVAKTKQENSDEQRQRQHQQRTATIQTNLRQKMEAASDKYEDFDDVVMSSDLPISPGMAEVIAESDIGGELAYYLGKNRAEAARIAAMSPLAAAKELGRIESKLGNAAPANVSNAPKPPTPVGNRATSSKDPDKMSVEEWTEWRNTQLSKKRRA